MIVLILGYALSIKAKDSKYLTVKALKNVC